jgi:hypothetical protein
MSTKISYWLVTFYGLTGLVTGVVGAVLLERHPVAGAVLILSALAHYRTAVHHGCHFGKECWARPW